MRSAYSNNPSSFMHTNHHRFKTVFQALLGFLLTALCPPLQQSRESQGSIPSRSSDVRSSSACWHKKSRSSWNKLFINTVFDLISRLFAYVIFGKKNALISEPPWTFFFLVSTVSVHYAISFIFYILCLRLSRVQNSEGRKEIFILASTYYKMIGTIQYFQPWRPSLRQQCGHYHDGHHK